MTYRGTLVRQEKKIQEEIGWVNNANNAEKGEVGGFRFQNVAKL